MDLGAVGCTSAFASYARGSKPSIGETGDSLVKGGDTGALGNRRVNACLAERQCRTGHRSLRLRASDSLHDTTSYAYNLAGKETSVTDGSGKAMQFTYDALGRVETEILPPISLVLEGPRDSGGVAPFLQPSRSQQKISAPPM